MPIGLSPATALCLAALISARLATADTLTSGGVERHYEVFRPEGTAEPRPAVFLLHGGAGTAEDMRRYTGFDSLAEEAGIVAVYPQGIGRRWNDGRLYRGIRNLNDRPEEQDARRSVSNRQSGRWLRFRRRGLAERGARAGPRPH